MDSEEEESRPSLLAGDPIRPGGLRPDISVADLVDSAYLAYNAGRLQQACQLLCRCMLQEDVTVCLTLSGALTPAGLGQSVIIPMIRAGFVDWIISTGANLYHDAHFGLGLTMHRGHPNLDDRLLRRQGVVRIYDILFDYNVLLKTDLFLRHIMEADIFQERMSSARLHHLIGQFLAAREDELGLKDTCLLSTAYRTGVPCYVSSPGDSSIGMNVAALNLHQRGPTIDPSTDVNETAAIVYDAKKRGGKSGLIILGGGSPKNFALQTEPQIQEVLGLAETGHDFFLQITDARPDTGGLSGATPAEAVTWGKVVPDRLPEAVVCYTDSTIAAPILACYALTRHKPRQLRRLTARREELLASLRSDHARRLEE
ncbi:MAG: deoxyhypusine synthase [Acidobacteriota bacterium]